MKVNPILRRELMVSSRGAKTAAILIVFNGILALTALINMYAAVMQMKVTAQMQYSSFLELYLFVASIEFIMLLLIVPAITSGSISSEKEKQTLDLLMLTDVSPWEIVWGKLLSGLATMFILVISSFPIFALVLIYGGITLRDLMAVLACYASTACFVGSMGLCFSALLKKTLVSTVVVYTVLVLTVLGTYGINYFQMMISYIQVNQSVAVSSNSGGFLYLMLMNPAAAFYTTIARQLGNGQSYSHISQWFGPRDRNFITSHWLGFSIGIQLALSAALLWIAAIGLPYRTSNYKKHLH